MEKIKKYLDFLNENQIQQTTKKNLQLSKYASMIDFTYIKPNAPDGYLDKMVEAGRKYGFFGIVVDPKYVDRLSYDLTDDDMTIISILDFPYGNSPTKNKLSMAIELIADGAEEIDMVMDYKKLKKAYKEEDEETKKSLLDQIENDIVKVANECHKNGVLLKVIIESGLLTFEEIKLACELVSNGGADFVQTSTGTQSVGAELVKVKEMRRVLPDYVKIKVAGGIRTLQQCEMYYPYVDRIGTSVIPK